jgi:hypothetical protein
MSDTNMRPFGLFLADIIEAGSAHPLDGGMSAQIDRDGYTRAWRKRVVEQLREQAGSMPPVGPKPPACS